MTDDKLPDRQGILERNPLLDEISLFDFKPDITKLVEASRHKDVRNDRLQPSDKSSGSTR